MAATYHFRAIASDGKVRTGSLTGENEKRVAFELRRQGLTPVYVGLASRRPFEIQFPKLPAARRKDVLFFTQEMATLLGAGVPLDRALSITSELSARKEFRSVVLDILRVLKGGKSFADALATKPDHFGEIFINMVRAGEASGSLAPIFDRLSEYEKTKDDLRGYVISSLVYPGLLTVVGAGAIFVLLYYVVPRFAQVFADTRMRIPAPTLALIEVSAWTRAWGPWVLAVAALAFALFRYYISTPAGRQWWDGVQLRIPLLGDALRKAQTAQFSRAMSTLVANGVPLVQSLQISRAIVTNRKMSDSLEVVVQGVKRGEGVSAPLGRTGQFPPLAAHLLAVGEETGRLDTMFQRAAEIYDADTRASIKRFTSLFEPLIILVLGIAVGVLILSMLLAITSINEVVV